MAEMAARDRKHQELGDALVERRRHEVTIVGAGLVGSLLAVVLRSRGYRVTVYEGRRDPREGTQENSAGRSINLVATARGLKALSTLPPDVATRLKALGTKVYGRVIHTSEGQILAQKYGKDDDEYNISLSRSKLNDFLLGEAEKAGACIKFGHRLCNVKLPTSDESPTQLEFTMGGGGTCLTACFGPVIGSDGAGSALRRAVPAFEASSDILAAGYKEVLLPAHCSQTLDQYGLHIWPRGDHFLMGLANKDGSFTGTLYLANEGDLSFSSLNSEEKWRQFLHKHYADALPFMDGVDKASKQLYNNPLGMLGTVKVAPWRVGNRIALVGDAAHAVVPFFGQGMNCGFEDVDCLASELSTRWPPSSGTPQKLEQALESYARRRKPNADAIATMALENYVEMMRSTGDPVFRSRKAIEAALERDAELGASFRSRYAMVCYGGGQSRGSVGYLDALKLGEAQWGVVCDLAEGFSGSDSQEADAFLDRKRAAQLLEERVWPLQKELGVDLATVGIGSAS